MDILGKWATKTSRKLAGKLGIFLATAFGYVAGDSLGNLGATFTGPAARSYFDATGTLQTVTANVARDGNYINGARTWLLEAARTNSFLNSGTPATHTSPSLALGTYTLWLVGSGSIAVAQTTAVITGAGTATAAAPKTFTVTTAGTVTFTVTGSVTRAQCENTAFPTSYITTTGAAVTQAVEVNSIPFGLVPQAMTVYLKFIERGSVQLTGNQRVFQLGDTTAAARIFNVCAVSGVYKVFHQSNGSSSVSAAAASAPSIGDTVELRAVLNADGSVFLGQSINGGAEVVSAASAGFALASTWAAPAMTLNQSAGGGSAGFIALMSAKVSLGVHDLSTLRAA